MPRGVVFLPVLVLLAAGCFGGGGGAKSISAANGESLVLAQSDVGSEFRQFDRGSQKLSDLSPPRDDLNRLGRKGGWKARFSRPGTRTTDGPLVISSLADLFSSETQARGDFDLYKLSLSEFETAGGKPVVSDEPFADDFDAVTYRQGLPPNAVRYYVIAWREGTVTASVNVSGFKLTWEQAVALAQKQDRRIRAAQ